MRGKATSGSEKLSEEGISGGGSGEPHKELLMAKCAACVYVYARRGELWEQGPGQ